MILVNLSNSSLDTDKHAVPTVHVNPPATEAIKAKVTANPAITVSLVNKDTTGLPLEAQPQIAGFSSRGPLLATDSDLLKPDVAAPGVAVLAGVSPIGTGGDKVRVHVRHLHGRPARCRLRRAAPGQEPELVPGNGQVRHDDHGRQRRERRRLQEHRRPRHRRRPGGSGTHGRSGSGLRRQPRGLPEVHPGHGDQPRPAVQHAAAGHERRRPSRWATSPARSRSPARSPP